MALQSCVCSIANPLSPPRQRIGLRPSPPQYGRPHYSGQQRSQEHADLGGGKIRCVREGPAGDEQRHRETDAGQRRHAVGLPRTRLFNVNEIRHITPRLRTDYAVTCDKERKIRWLRCTNASCWVTPAKKPGNPMQKRANRSPSLLPPHRQCGSCLTVHADAASKAGAARPVYFALIIAAWVLIRLR